MKQQFNKKSLLLYIGFSLLLFLLFGLKDILVLASENWPHLYSIVNSPRSSWEEVYCYFPYANHFSLNNILPAAPMSDPGLSRFTFFPLITLIAQGVVFKCICFSNPDAYFFVMHTVFPVLSFWLIFSIFKRYIGVPWSLILAFCGTTSFPNFVLGRYLLNLFICPAGFIETASLSPMELGRAPVPSFTFFFFILTFYASIKYRKPSRNYCLFISVMWALNLYVYLFNFIAGTLFWVLYLIHMCHLKERRFKLRNVISVVLLNVLVIFIIISPIVLKRLFFLNPLDKEMIQRMEIITSTAGFIAGDWGWMITYMLPIFVTLVVIWIFCADYYELYYRFTPVFIMIFVELFVSNMHILFGSFYQPQLFNLRIADYFLRYLYFIPIIYFLSRPSKKLFHNKTKRRVYYDNVGR